MDETSFTTWERIEDACHRFEVGWQEGAQPAIESFLEQAMPAGRAELFFELLLLELHYRRRQGELPRVADYRARFVDRSALVEEAFRDTRPARPAPAVGNTVAGPPVDALPGSRVADRYEIRETVGDGAFGRVCRAVDTWLKREVALKFPRAGLWRSEGDVDRFLREARVVSQLVHPHIVRLYDVAYLSQGRPFLIMEFVVGGSLKNYVGALSWSEAARLLMQVANAIDYAHREDPLWGKRRVIHRDLKPANILIDARNGYQPLVTDFGLAVHDLIQPLDARELAGSWSYMAPEQISRDAFLDYRIDIWALGVILYELLAHRKPFVGGDEEELGHRIVHDSPPPLGERDIPPALAAVCRKALQKDRRERYSTAGEMAADLGRAVGQEPRPAVVRVAAAPRVIPRGLRAFDRDDSDFFLDLLPGPKDAAGLPDVLRFWKLGIESCEADAFAVGVLYGASGSGKSSLVKAGLLPRLAPHVRDFYLVATPDDTERRLQRKLAGLGGEPPLATALVERMAALAGGRGLDPGAKVLVVLDQFERWLAVHAEDPDAALTRALRRCHGPRVQCLLVVRNDFATAVTRFLRHLGVPCREGYNMAGLELFDVVHARHVLARFGQAWERLPADAARWTATQKRFLETSLHELAAGGRVAPIQISLLAELLKSAECWSEATLRELGGAAGLAANFLEAAFRGPHARLLHRQHEPAACRVLRELLPEGASVLASRRRTRSKLLEASGYAGQPAKFAELLEILDRDLRLITPTETPAASAADELGGAAGAPLASACGGGASEPSFRLAHDFLVPPLRQWLDRRQRATRRGRAELLLAERAAAWSAGRRRQRLPTLDEWLRIRLFTKKRGWTPSQRQTMRAAGRRFALLLMCVLTLTALAAWRETSRRGLARRQAWGLIKEVLAGEPEAAAAAAAELHKLGSVGAGALEEALTAAAARDARDVLRLQFAHLPRKPDLFDELVERWLELELPAADALLPMIKDHLSRHPRDADRFIARLVRELQRADRDLGDRLRYESQLAVTEGTLRFDAGSVSARRRRAEALFYLGRDVEAVEELSLLIDRHRDQHSYNDLAMRAIVYARLGHREAAQRDLQRCRTTAPPRRARRPYLLYVEAVVTAATQGSRAVLHELDGIARIVAGQPGGDREFLFYAACAFSMVPKRDAAQAAEDAARAVELFRQAVELGMTEYHRMQIVELAAIRDHALFQQIVNSHPQHASPIAGRRMNAAVALLHLEVATIEAVWQLLSRDHDPQLQAELLHALPRARPDVEALARRIAAVADPARKQMLLLALGELNPGPQMLAEVREIHRRHADAGVHAAAAWVLRHAEPRSGGQVRNEPLPRGAPAGQGGWYVNGQGQQMVRLAGPLQFWMGRPPPPGRKDAASFRYCRIERSFDIAATEVTVGQFRRFRPGHAAAAAEYDAELPVAGVAWDEAAAYCNWLSQQEDLAPDQWCYQAEGEGGDQRLVPAAGMLERRGYRLPTEEEWEYACRGGTRARRYCGDTSRWLHKYAHYSDPATRHPRRAPVAELKPNGFGLFDMLGNVQEWCQEDPPTVRSDPQRRVVRGGSFNLVERNIHAAYGSQIPSAGAASVGFRVARTASADG